jgi:protein-S-isoprenylcysteine O-methyltransferase Ste14
MHWTQVALAVTLIIYIGAFTTIMVRVRRSTGTNPKGHTGGHHLAAALNIVATSLLLLTAISYPLDAGSMDWLGRIPLLDHAVAQAIGAGALTLAVVLLIWGEISLGRSFRVALPESRQPLVTHGIYRFTRNPLALSVDLLALGILLLAPNWAALASLVLNVASYEWKIRIEEAYLREAHGEAYTGYCARTRRYLPRLSRRPDSR